MDRHPGIPLCDCIKAKQLYPERFILGYAPHPLHGDAPQLFESAYHIHGVRVCGELKARVLYDDPRCINLFRKAGQLGCPVILHIDVPYLPDNSGALQYQSNWYGGTVDNLKHAMQSCPETNFIGHAPGFWREISGDAKVESKVYPDNPVKENGKLWRLFEEFPNLYGDLSAGSGLMALKRDRKHAIQFITTFSDQLLFGRDQFGKELQEFVNSLEISQTILNKIYYKNAQTLIHSEKYNTISAGVC